MVDGPKLRYLSDKEVVQALKAAEPSARITEHEGLLRRFQQQDVETGHYRELIDRAHGFHIKGLTSKLLTTLANLDAEAERLLKPDEKIVRAGERVIESTSRGGRMKAESQKEDTDRRLAAMQEYLDRGHSIANAARLAYENDFGSSESANRKLWYAHRK